MEDIEPLTPEQIVLVKEAWNKSLAWKDQVMEGIFFRWLEITPGLKDLLASFFETMIEDLFTVFDIAVRDLDPATEIIQREAYRGVHPRSDREFTSMGEYMTYFADIRLKAEHWQTLRKAFIFGLSCYAFYLDEEEIEDLATAEKSPKTSVMHQFFGKHLINPAVEAIDAVTEYYSSPAVTVELAAYWQEVAGTPEQMDNIAQTFYKNLFKDSPQLLDYFKDSNIDALGGHFSDALNLLVKAASSGSGMSSLAGRLHRLAAVHEASLIPTWTYNELFGSLGKTLLAMKRATPQVIDALKKIYFTTALYIKQPMYVQEQIMAKARSWFLLYAREKGWAEMQYNKRMMEVMIELSHSGTYSHTSDEIQHGCQVAWRNSSKCVGRINWNTLLVRDKRHVTDPDNMFTECMEHLRLATMGENLQSVMTIFRPRQRNETWGVRFWNIQFTAYACYETEDGGFMGDPATKHLTKALIEKMGWIPPEPRSQWDLLPLVIEKDGEPPKMYELPSCYSVQIMITHPTNEAFNQLGLRWHAVPTISNFAVKIGGIDYVCNAFNGWYVEMEIARDLWERMEKQKEISRCFNLDVEDDTSNWQEIGFAELNRAIVYSFRKAKMSIVDHQTVCKQFLTHLDREKKVGREVPGQWSWIGGFTGLQTPLWKRELRDFALFPQYHYQSTMWEVKLNAGIIKKETSETDAIKSEVETLSVTAVNVRIRNVLILFGSETGTSERYAKLAARALRYLNPVVAGMDIYSTAEKKLSMVRFTDIVVITSTFGAGGPPFNARTFLNDPLPSLQKTSFAVLAVGSSSYPNYCAYGATIDHAFQGTGAKRMFAMMKADDINNSQATFEAWLKVLIAQFPSAAEYSDVPVEPTRFIHEVLPESDPRVAELRQRSVVTFPDRLGNLVKCPCVKSAQLMSSPTSAASTRMVSFNLQGTNMTYVTGDHLSVLPANDLTDCSRLAAMLGLKLEDVIMGWEVTPSSGDKSPAMCMFTLPARVGDLLRFQVDLRLHDVCMELVTMMYEHRVVPDEIENEKVSMLRMWSGAFTNRSASDNAMAEAKGLVEQLSDRFFTIAALLFEFADICALNLIDLLQIMPPLKPRYYSISSSSLVNPKEVFISVGLVAFNASNGVERYGLCSRMLNDIKPGDFALISISTSTFRSPSNLFSPVLLLGAGTGLAPMIGFCEERDHLIKAAGGDKNVVGPAVVFSGCRSSGMMIYKEQLDEWKSSGAVTSVEIALSREPGVPKTYIQDSLVQNGETIAKMLSDPNCYYYICGDAKVADSVYEALISVLVTHHKISRVSASRNLRSMMVQGRYQLDIWGCAAHLDVSDMIAQREDNGKTKAMEWLASVATKDEMEKVQESVEEMWRSKTLELEAKLKQFEEVAKPKSKSSFVAREGWIHKKGHMFTNWSKRWFVLEKQKLSYYEDETKQTLKGSYVIDTETNISRSPEESGYKNVFVLHAKGTGGNSLVMSAASSGSMERWEKAIRNNVDTLRSRLSELPINDSRGCPFSGKSK